MLLQNLNVSNLREISEKYNIPFIDSMLISLNTLGAKSDLPFLRVRFRIKVLNYEKEFYYAICLNTTKTPFLLQGVNIKLGDETVAIVKNLENDIAELSYFRKNGNVLVLNLNRRTKCLNCEFCGARFQTERFSVRLTDKKSIELYFSFLEEMYGKLFKKLEEIAINTGLFLSEERVLKHLEDVSETAKTFGFKGEIKYIGSEISEKGIERIAKKTEKFSYYLTLETFENRILMNNTKSLMDVKKAKKILKLCKENGIPATILYVLGLEPLKIFKHGIREISPFLTRFPVINIFQVYDISQNKIRHPEATEIEYFLSARKFVEKLFEERELRPRLWENYRGLWYTSFSSEVIKNEEIKLQTFTRAH